MNEHRELVTRKAELLITEALGDTRVVAVNSARQVGKSTLAKLAASAATNPPALSIMTACWSSMRSS